jgi:hypothetical protein
MVGLKGAAMIDQYQSVERGAILRHVIEILTDITADWDIVEISSKTCLGDLGLESISLVYLIAEIQQYYNLQDLLFKKLRTAEIKVTDLQVADLVDFISELLATPSVGGGGSPA